MAKKTKKVNPLRPKKSFSKHLNAVLEKEHKEKDQVFPIRPSAAGHCSRKLAYDYARYKGWFKGEPISLSAREIRLFGLGHVIESQVIEYFKKLEKKTGYKVDYLQHAIEILEINQDLKVTGHIDFALVGEHDAKIVDVKSAKDRFDRAYQSKWDALVAKFDKMESIEKLDSDEAWYISNLEAFLEELFDPFFTDNFLQLNLYCCSDWAQAIGVTQGIIYRYNKNDSRHLEIWFEPSFKLADKVKNKFLKVVRTVDKTHDPEKVEREYTLGHVRCAYCPYRDVCWKDKDAQAEFMKKVKQDKKTIDFTHKKVGKWVDKLSELWYSKEKVEREVDELANRFVTWMVRTGTWKLKAKDGRVFELKYYRSPKPHYRLVESKRE